eukprot:CAMPEP_0202687732 /NCGR_PEP_ID=MMETSP1385-20130828/3371_1 /ASSEMBLY_ACC=CAM_ASM_000861 /TAXON_ID=933848 /ORGANISM="Elphidium margaritaceum" /LENGTH=338 /DNA_ID=CAMNT_0049342573 /DNA_START=17 /DNA_END=1033 /DNA_ORIENTATION=+
MTDAVGGKKEKKLKAILCQRGYAEPVKIADTLQGTIWRCTRQKNKESVVAKISSKELTSESSVLIQGAKYKIHESILHERDILKYLNKDANRSPSIIRFIEFMKSNVNFYLIMEDGGHSLFNFNIKVHEYIKCDQIDISEYHKLVKVLFKALVDCVEYIHSKQVAHFDISLENILIPDIDVTISAESQKLVFCYDVEKNNNCLVKLCDFGLATVFDGNSAEQKENLFTSTKFCGKAMYQSPEITKHKGAFDARKNDIWCLGVCLFMLVTGNAPFRNTSDNDPYLQLIMAEKGDVTKLIAQFGKQEYVNDELIELFRLFFQYEDKRADIDAIKASKWLK